MDKPRSEMIGPVVTEIVEGMGATDLTPQEAMIAAELILWTLMQNSMKLAAPSGPEMLAASKQVASRALLRISSRVEAWPAKVEDNN